jgi:hypothetical protein
MDERIERAKSLLDALTVAHEAMATISNAKNEQQRMSG